MPAVWRAPPSFNAQSGELVERSSEVPVLIFGVDNFTHDVG